MKVCLLICGIGLDLAIFPHFRKNFRNGKALANERKAIVSFVYWNDGIIGLKSS